MLIGNKSKYLLKKTRSKAKMYEYNIPEHLHIEVEDKVSDLLLIAIGAIGNISATILRNISEDKNIEELVKSSKSDLEFSSKFFDSYLNSKIDNESENYYLLMGAIAYFFCDYIGSSSVLINKIDNKNLDLNANGIEIALVDLLKGNLHIKNYSEISEGPYKKHLIELIKDLKLFYENGDIPNIENIKGFQKLVYSIGSPLELLLADSLLAIYVLKVNYSANVLLPIYTDIDRSKWWNVLSNNGLVRELWPSQRRLGEAGVFNGESAIIQMPTSSGKTKSISITIEAAFLSGRTNLVIVIAPFRALCREIHCDLEEDFKFDNNVYINQMSDILSIDSIQLNKYNETDKNVLILTPEKLLYLLRHRSDLIRRIGLIIFDEGHLFDEPYRGIVYELLISMLRSVLSKDTQKVLISAVIPNAEQINNWINGGQGVVISDNTIKSTEKTISINDWRVGNDKLYGYLHFLNPDNPDEEEFFVPRTIELHNLNNIGNERKRKTFPQIDTKKLKVYNNDVAIYYGLKLCKNGGVAIFCGKKDTANKILERILDIGNRGYDISNLERTSNKNEVTKITNLIDKNYGTDNIYYRASQKSAFSHHAGISNGIKISIEHSMRKGYLNFIVCTSTLAQGVNLPIKYLIISSFYQGKDLIKVRDFHNLIGRAGRSGIYTEGSVILSESFVYNRRNNYKSRAKWKWHECKRFINIKNSEDCSSTLLTLIRDYNINNKYSLYIENIISSYYENHNDFLKELNKFKKTVKSENSEVFNDVDEKLRQIFIALDSLESFLMSYLVEEDWNICEANIMKILENTLAYHLADENEKDRLLNLFITIGRYCVNNTKDINTRFIYSKSMLGVLSMNRIEDYINENIDSILESKDIFDLFSILFPIVYKSLNKKNKLNFESDDTVREIGVRWLNGESYYRILEKSKENNYRIKYRNGFREVNLDDIIKLCDNVLGYESTVIISAISEVVCSKISEQDLVMDIFRHLISSLRYGVYSNLAIEIYELGFSDRVVAQDLSTYIYNISYREVTKAQIKKYMKEKKSDIQQILSKYPSVFMDRLNCIIK